MFVDFDRSTQRKRGHLCTHTPLGDMRLEVGAHLSETTSDCDPALRKDGEYVSR